MGQMLRFIQENQRGRLPSKSRRNCYECENLGIEVGDAIEITEMIDI